MTHIEYEDDFRVTDLSHETPEFELVMDVAHESRLSLAVRIVKREYEAARAPEAGPAVLE